MFGQILDMLFPPTCWVHRTAPSASFGLSELARQQIAELASQTYCRRCGLTTGPYTTNDRKHPCGRCHERTLTLAAIARVGTFSEPLISLVHRLKFGRSWEIAPIVAPYLHHAITQISEETATPVDILVPVPLHWRRRAQRGFNQSEELARHTAGFAHWKIAMPLRRVKNTTEQARIGSPTQRLQNLHNAFIARSDPRIAGKHLWLIDDVSTTGATLHAAATAFRKLPKESRPASLNAALLCITDHDSPSPTS